MPKKNILSPKEREAYLTAFVDGLATGDTELISVMLVLTAYCLGKGMSKADYLLVIDAAWEKAVCYKGRDLSLLPLDFN